MSGVIGPASAPGRLTIDLGALAGNWRELARRTAPGRCGAVVKADAYGTGVSEAAPELWAAGARVFFVAHFSEGLAARRVLPAEARIYVLNGLESGAEPADYAAHGLAPAIGGEDELRRWSVFATQRSRFSPCALHLDTGMNRLGFESLAQLRAAMETYGERSGADLLMSHFVSSEIPGDPSESRLRSSGSKPLARPSRAFPLRSPTRPESSSPRGRSTTWPVRATPSTAAIRRRAPQTRCAPSLP